MSPPFRDAVHQNNTRGTISMTWLSLYCLFLIFHSLSYSLTTVHVLLPMTLTDHHPYGSPDVVASAALSTPPPLLLCVSALLTCHSALLTLSPPYSWAWKVCTFEIGRQSLF